MEAFSFRSPSYVVRTRHSYCFRMVVPKDLRETVGLRELKYSLRTGAIGEAKYRARRMAAFVQALFRRLRRRQVGMTQPSKAEIKGMLEEHLRKTLEEAEEDRAFGIHPIWVGHDEDEDPIQARVEMLGYLESDFREDLARLKYGRAKPAVEEFLAEREFEADPSSDLYKWLCREMMKVIVRYLHEEQRRTVGDYSEDLQVANTRPSQADAQEKEEESYPLSHVIEHYVNEKMSGEGWTEKTLAENLAIYDLFVDLFGNLPIRSIDTKIMRDYKESLMRLPPNMKKSPKYRDLSPQEILEMDVDKPMSTTTINKHLRRFGALLSYAEDNGYILRKPTVGKLPEGKRDYEYRAEFDDQDLKKLLCSPDYLEDDHKHSYAFWMPLLAYFTGCRLEELAQLHLEDIRDVEGVWVIDVNDKEEKKVKTPSSVRLVPIHSFLLNELAFLQYVESLRRKGETRLFPELTRRRDGYGQTVTKWFARYKERCGIDAEGGKKVFHSFRHTFINRLKQDTTVNDTLISELAGHSVGNITMGRYGKRYRPQTLKEAVEKLEVGFSLDHIKQSKYIAK